MGLAGGSSACHLTFVRNYGRFIGPRGAERLDWHKEKTMAWSKPEFEELRFGFEVTMYIWNR
jgi:coenzyme PQQ precursor peptide PqqA